MRAHGVNSTAVHKGMDGSHDNNGLHSKSHNEDNEAEISDVALAAKFNSRAKLLPKDDLTDEEKKFAGIAINGNYVSS